MSQETAREKCSAWQKCVGGMWTKCVNGINLDIRINPETGKGEWKTSTGLSGPSSSLFEAIFDVYEFGLKES